MSRRFQFSLKALLVGMALLAASFGAAIEGASQAKENRARPAVALFFLSGAMLGAAVGIARGRSVIKGALWGMLFWPAIAMFLFIAGVLYSGEFFIAAY